ncbi:hypothetical protein KNU48_gp113 [Mycobacterium phage Silverleaf]|uniref:Uncharacterized protein n=1 Tax=Mycobacterium phage Silverleaf TaxID=2517969 RepID=A0A482JBW2_9CAUD|nr:hypothetical protein KNU48_gp113 [Mycobacterium phage Silverleaf]QBP29132.1 hypothetical protein SEA_SILVERLEAF_47 [Mycobacterium phage Silverleaf]
MKASQRLAERNDILEVINEIDSDLWGLADDDSLSAAKQRREMLETRHSLARELNKLGFMAPELDERLKEHEGFRNGARYCAGDDELRSGGSVVAKRRIGPSPQAG